MSAPPPPPKDDTIPTSTTQTPRNTDHRYSYQPTRSNDHPINPLAPSYRSNTDYHHTRSQTQTTPAQPITQSLHISNTTPLAPIPSQPSAPSDQLPLTRKILRYVITKPTLSRTWEKRAYTEEVRTAPPGAEMVEVNQMTS